MSVISPLTLPGMPGPRVKLARRPRIEPNRTGKKDNVMMSNDILLCSQIGAFPNCHQRDFIQQLMKIGAEINSQTLDSAWRILPKTGKKDFFFF